MALLYVVFFAYLVAALSLICGLPVTKSAFPIATLLAYLLTYFRFYRNSFGKSGAKEIAIGLSAILASLIISGSLYDNSYDGNQYHQEIIANLLNGWNPFNFKQFVGLECDLWCRHYAKGMELAETSVASFTGHLETGKSINLLLAISTFLILYNTLGALNREMSAGKKFALSLVIIGNPIVVNQLFTFYVDFTKYLFFLLSLIFIFRIYLDRGSKKRKTADEFNLIIVSILCISVKFNIFCEEYVLLLLAFIWFAVKKEWVTAKSIARCGAISLVIGLLLNYSPLYFNYLVGGNPFYPLMGSRDTVDIMSGITPPGLGRGRIPDFFTSLFSFHLPKVAQRMGGYGPFMGLLSLLSAFVMIYYRKVIPAVWQYIFICAFLSCFIFEQSWWARYISQLWLLPSIALTVCCVLNRGKWLRITFFALMAATMLLSLVHSLGSTLQTTVYRHVIYNTIGDEEITIFNSDTQFQRHLSEGGVRFQKADTLVIPDGKRAVVFYGQPDMRNYDQIKLHFLMIMDSSTSDKILQNAAECHLDTTSRRL